MCHVRSSFPSRAPAQSDYASAAADDVDSRTLAPIRANSAIEYQVEKQLAGQFDWVITCPAPNKPPDNQDVGSASHGNSRRGNEALVFGCNLLRRAHQTASSTGCGNEDYAADSYTFIATPLKENNALLNPPTKGSRDLECQVAMTVSQHLAPPGKSPKHAEEVEVVELAPSPSLSQVSDRSGSLAAQLGDSVPGARIEDSLEELDKLEDELEAVSFVTGSGRTERRKTTLDAAIPFDAKGPSPKNRASVQHATTRGRVGERTQQDLRRSSSVQSPERKQKSKQGVPETKKTAPRATPVTSGRPSEARARTVKSTKPLTVPKFELPGEAVSRRLKEQREARLAQQAEAQKSQGPPSRVKSSRPPTKPKFELPGEAISRRKREEREAKLRAQEEEERRRREFKARPVRHSIAPSTVPRETITSRARQSLAGGEDGARAKRFSTANALGRLAVTSSTANKAPQARGRNSMIAPFEIGSRTASVSTSVSDKRSSVSVEEAAHQRARGREIYTRDSSYAQDQERLRREREAAAKAAREAAAERSRAASREWAEKKRQRERAARESTSAQARG